MALQPKRIMEKPISDKFIESLSELMRSFCEKGLAFKHQTLVSGQLFVSFDNGESTEFAINEKIYTSQSQEGGYTFHSTSNYVGIFNSNAGQDGSSCSEVDIKTLNRDIDEEDLSLEDDIQKDVTEINENSDLNIQQDETLETMTGTSGQNMLDHIKDTAQIHEPSKSQTLSSLDSSGKPISSDLPKARLPTKNICAICGDRALSKNYGVYSCSCCKGFFKRTIERQLTYDCNLDKMCTIDQKNRKKCQYCRYIKCINLGMDIAKLRKKKKKQVLKSEVYADEEQTKTAEQSDTKEGSYTCGFCPEVFTQQKLLNAHQKTHTLACRYCGKDFSKYTPSRLLNHERTHTRVAPFVCETCGKRFVNSGNLSSHRTTHLKEKKYKCTVCGSSYQSSGGLRRHIKIHSGERPAVCQFCGKSFTDAGYLKDHLVKHTGERKFECEFCGDKFKASGHLRTHKKLKHSKEVGWDKSSNSYIEPRTHHSNSFMEPRTQVRTQVLPLEYLDHKPVFQMINIPGSL